MFDEDDYYSDEEDNVQLSHKNIPSSKVLVPSSGSDFNHLAGEADSLMKMMKDRGLDLTENEMKKMSANKSKDKNESKSKPKTGFFDGGDKASVEQLIRALNKSFSQADPQQASCILSYLLEKTSLSASDRNKFSIMKCNILFGLGAYEDCLDKAQKFVEKPLNKLSAAIFSNFMAKCKSQNGNLLSGYMDFLRAKSLFQQYKQQVNQSQRSTEGSDQKDEKNSEDYKESDIETTLREINHTEMEYNIKMGKYRNTTNLIYPYFTEFRHRRVLQVVCGDYHTLFLVGGALSDHSTPDGPWANEVFGLGQNTVGQITGRERKVIYKDPVLISQLSGKGIEGVYAYRQSSLAYDGKGNIYQWGIKEKRNEQIDITFTVGEQVKKLEKGYKHYALLTKSGKFYCWGTIEMKSAAIYSQAKPSLQESKNIIDFSCGGSHTVAIDASGSAYCLGSNQNFQLGIYSEKLTKSFKKIDAAMLGQICKVFCINDCTFLANADNELFFCGRYSLKKEPQEKFRQAEFADEFRDIVAITGSTGSYYLTNERGTCFKWDVDTMVKFKADRENEQISQRYVQACRGTVLRVRSMIRPELCRARRTTQELKTYEPIMYEIELRDEFGLFGVSDLIIPPKCQIFLSTYRVKKEDLLRENKAFTQGHNFCSSSNKILLNEIIENRLLQFQISRNGDEPWRAEMKIAVQASGKYFFYIILEESLVLEEELSIQVSEKENELEEKTKQDRLLKEEEKRRKAEIERQRLAEERLKKQLEEEERRKQTQRRAEEALKKHMREQEEAKTKQQQDRKARKQLMTGGGFDLTKLKKKSSTELTGVNNSSNINPLSSTITEKIERPERVEKLERTSQSFLPDINQRPNSRKKITLPKPSQLVGSFRDSKPAPILKTSVTDFSSTGFSIKEQPTVNQRPSTPKQRESLLNANTATSGILKSSLPKASTTTGIVKRGLSKKKNG